MFTPFCGNSHQNILLRDSCFREADPTTWSVTRVLAALVPLYRPDIPLALRYLQNYHNMRPGRCQTCIPYFLHLCISFQCRSRPNTCRLTAGLAEMLGGGSGVQARPPTRGSWHLRPRSVQVAHTTRQESRISQNSYRACPPVRPLFLSGRWLVSGAGRRKITGV
jgi:hypothetical protein